MVALSALKVCIVLNLELLLQVDFVMPDTIVQLALLFHNKMDVLQEPTVRLDLLHQKLVLLDITISILFKKVFKTVHNVLLDHIVMVQFQHQ